MGPNAASPMVCVGRCVLHPQSTRGRGAREGIRGLLSGIGLILSLSKISQVDRYPYLKPRLVVGHYTRFECIVCAAWSSLGTAWPCRVLAFDAALHWPNEAQFPAGDSVS